MFSRKLILAIAATFVFLSVVAFIIGKPPYKDKRLYPIISQYTPYKIEFALGGLVIKKKNDPKFKLEPDAKSFYHVLQELEKKWAKDHLKISNNTLLIYNDNKEIVKKVKLNNQKEINFIKEYYGVKND